ncbi:MAG: hypothetical protein HQ517_15320, partial [SAR324 cluster bacterium]|nr:hypothetical protein [SAR324 cluster bacterium]
MISQQKHCADILEIHGESIMENPGHIFEGLRRGDIFVIRNLGEIHTLRESLLDLAAQKGPDAVSGSLQAFLSNGDLPDETSMAAFVQALNTSAACRFVPSLMADFVQQCGFPEPLMLESGVHRVVLPAAYREKLLNRRDLFAETDFKRKIPSGQPETFLPLWSSPHRDLNRPHYTFMANLWFPLHDLDAEESLIFFPSVYHELVKTNYRSRPEVGVGGSLDPEEWGLGPPVRVALKFGDALLFHSEHVHCSPINPLGRRRISYDFRITASCLDDNSSYRDIFWNMNNFLPATDLNMGVKASDSIIRSRELLM